MFNRECILVIFPPFVKVNEPQVPREKIDANIWKTLYLFFDLYSTTFWGTFRPLPPTQANTHTHTFEDTGVLAKPRAANTGLKELTEFSSVRPLSARAIRHTWADIIVPRISGGTWHRRYAAGVGTGARRSLQFWVGFAF